MPRTMIQVGTDGMGNVWCRHVLPPEVANGTVEVVAAVDVQRAALINAQERLELGPEQCYTDASPAGSP